MDTNRVRLEILKKIKSGSLHGYGLFLHLIQMGLVSKDESSDIYKILRRMKQDNLLDSKEIESKGKRKKEILSLTEKGLNEYYDRMMDSAKDFVDLLYEARIAKYRDKLFQSLLNNGIDLGAIKKKNSTIFLDFGGLRLERQFKVMELFLRPFLKTQLTIYCQNSTSREEIPFFFSEKMKLKYLDPNMNLNADTCDFIICFGYDKKSDLLRKLVNNNSWIDIIKKGGILFHTKILSPNKGMYLLMDEIIGDFPPYYQKKILKIMGFNFEPKIKSKEKPLENDEIIDLLSEYFISVQNMNLSDSVDIIIAKNPKRGNV